MKKNQPKPAPKPSKVIDFNALTSPKEKERKRMEELQKKNPGAPGSRKF